MAGEDRKDALPRAPELGEVAAAIERGRRLVRQAEQAAEVATQQAEEARVVADETDKALDRAQRLIEDIEAEAPRSEEG